MDHAAPCVVGMPLLQKAVPDAPCSNQEPAAVLLQNPKLTERREQHVHRTQIEIELVCHVVG